MALNQASLPLWLPECSHLKSFIEPSLEPAMEKIAITNGEALDILSVAFRGQPASMEELAEVSSLDAQGVRTWLATVAAQWAKSLTFRQRMGGFMQQYLGVNHLPNLDKDEEVFNDQMRGSMLQEFDRFVVDNFLDGEGSFPRLFQARESQAFRGLGAVYGNEQIREEKIFWKEDRRGALGLAGVLAASASTTGSDAVKRGVLVRTHLLCEPIPPPAPGADFSQIPTTDNMQSRERFEALAAATGCSACHMVLNPPGYLFESYDHMGRFRTEELGRPINAKGSIPPFFDDPPYPGADAEWNGLEPLAQWIAESRDARRCFAQQFVQFALAGAAPDASQNCGIDRLAERFVKSGNLADLAVDLADSDLLYLKEAMP